SPHRHPPSNVAAPPHSHALSLHDALPIYPLSFPVRGSYRPGVEVIPPDHDRSGHSSSSDQLVESQARQVALLVAEPADAGRQPRSEEHTSELQSRESLVCRLLLEKKNRPR